MDEFWETLSSESRPPHLLFDMNTKVLNIKSDRKFSLPFFRWIKSLQPFSCLKASFSTQRAYLTKNDQIWCLKVKIKFLNILKHL